MISFFGIAIDTLTSVLAVIATIIVAGVVLLALRNGIFFKIGVRNIGRRRLQMVLIVFALMLSTTLLSSVLATGDVLTSAVQSVAVYNWGNIDEVVEGGNGQLGTFHDDIYHTIANRSKSSKDIAAVAAALRETDLLVADQTSRQVRSNVTALAMLPGSEQGFGGMQDVLTKNQLTIADLKPNQVYINQTTAQLLNATTGDNLYLYSQRWPQRRYAMQVAAIVGNNGLVGDNPTLLGQLQAFQDIEGASGQINQVFIANRGGGGVNGVGLSNQVTREVHEWLEDDERGVINHGAVYWTTDTQGTVNYSAPRQPGTSKDFVHVTQVKQQGVQTSQNAEDIFSRVFSLFSLFALAIGLLLIILIFVLLAAERRAEMGMARAIGVQRQHIIAMFLFEGSVYDLLSSFIGVLVGIAAGELLIYFLQPVLARFNFPLKFTFQPHSLLLSYCLGIIFTFGSVVLSSWLVSRMTVVEAMRDLPEPVHVHLTLQELFTQLWQQVGKLRAGKSTSRKQRRRILFEHIPDILGGMLRELAVTGLLPLLVGIILVQIGLKLTQILPFSLGLTLLAVGVGLLIKKILTVSLLYIAKRGRWRQDSLLRDWNNAATGLFAALVGSALVAYWALPFDTLSFFGLPRFQGGIEVFFIAGVMMVMGSVWVLLANARPLAHPWLVLAARLPSINALARLASAYPLQRRFRTGLSVVMFSLVVFAMTVMAVITSAMQSSYVDINSQTGGYDIQATAYFQSLPDLQTSLAQHGINPAAFSAIGSRSTTAVGVIQLSSQTPRWSLYPAQIVSGSFLRGYGLHLSARASGFASDAAIWQALQSHPEYALIDSSALPVNPARVYDPSVPQKTNITPPGLDQHFTFAMSGAYQGDTIFPATPVWVVGKQGLPPAKLTVIGVVDNSDSAHFGLYISRNTYTAASLASADPTNITDPINPTNLTNITNATNTQFQSYYFKVAPGQDKRALALALGSAYLDNGLETTVLEDAIWQTRGPRILLSNVLLGVVGVTLLLGVAALAITGTRAVIERRQQIGMLRALGCSRGLVQRAFLLESFMIGFLGSLLGIVLGLILARNIFAANFFEQYQLGLIFSIPWSQLAIVVGVAFLASLIGAILPAWQAGRITPAEALRYT